MGLRQIEPDYALATTSKFDIISRKKAGGHRLTGWRKARNEFIRDAMIY